MSTEVGLFEKNDPAEMTTLLQNGASLADQTSKGCSLVHYMDAEMLGNLMDSCVTFERKGEETTASLNYENFLPNSTTTEVESVIVAYISRSYKYQHLLQHPLMVAYVTMKWHEVRAFRLFNFYGYLLFAFYILLRICLNHTFCGDWPLLMVTVLGLVPTILSLCVNVTSTENWMGLVASMTLISMYFVEGNEMSLLFIVVVLIGVKVFMMFGTFRMFAVYVDMFKIVVGNFCKFLLFYLALLIALTICFHISVMNRREGATSNYTVFVKPFNLLIANSEDDDFDNTSITGTIVHLFFIFMLPVVMSNLLIGLAVSDITDIRSKAELAFYCGRVQYAHAVELLHRDLACLRFLLLHLCGRPAIFFNKSKKLTAVIVPEAPGDYSCCITSFLRYVAKNLKKSTLIYFQCDTIGGVGKEAAHKLNDLYEKQLKKLGNEQQQFDRIVINDCYLKLIPGNVNKS